MTHIAIFPFPEEGHLIPTLSLARKLKAHGHHVSYLVLPDFAAFICNQGFECIPIMVSSFPQGSRSQQILKHASLKPSLFSKKGRQAFRELLLEIIHLRFQETICTTLLNEDTGESLALLGNRQPDLIFVDAFVPTIAIMTQAAAIPTILFNVTVNTSYEADVSLPPSTVALIPHKTLFSRFVRQSSWLATSYLKDLLYRLLGVHIDQSVRKVAQHYQFPLERVEKTPFYPRLKPDNNMPEIILCPRAFDFPHVDREGTYYLKSSFSIQQESVTFPWDKIATDKPLIFCTLGSQSHTFGNRLVFFQTVIDAVAQQQDWQLVLAVGRHLDIKTFRTSPANKVVIVNWAPHAQVLQRASIMINHAGLGTVMDCIHYEVPMIVFPLLRDQPGNAARVVYHGLGTMGNINTISAPQVLKLINTVMGNSTFKANIHLMNQKLQVSDEPEDSIPLRRFFTVLPRLSEG